MLYTRVYEKFCAIVTYIYNIYKKNKWNGIKKLVKMHAFLSSENREKGTKRYTFQIYVHVNIF